MTAVSDIDDFESTMKDYFDEDEQHLYTTFTFADATKSAMREKVWYPFFNFVLEQAKSGEQVTILTNSIDHAAKIVRDIRRIGRGEFNNGEVPRILRHKNSSGYVYVTAYDKLVMYNVRTKHIVWVINVCDRDAIEAVVAPYKDVRACVIREMTFCTYSTMAAVANSMSISIK